MRLTSSTALWALFASAATAPGINAKGLRRKLIAKNDCTLMAIETLALEDGKEPDMILECELNAEDADGFSGISAPIQATTEQLQELKDMIKAGELDAGEDVLDIEGDEIDENHQVKIEPTASIKAKAAKVKQGKADKRRRLVSTSGDLKMLLVKVTDSGGLTYPDSPATMSDEVFGTGVDPINLKSGLEECSFNKINVLPKALTVDGVPDDTHEVATGVIQVTIDISLTNQSDSAIRNAVTTKVQQLLGYGLPGPYDYVLYSLEKCYGGDCEWAAYAYINSWNSVYQNVYYKRPGVLLHEIGHNFGLAHSGGLDGATYTDHTCTMGNPHYSDDDFQCFNPAKNFQLDWYDDAKITEDPRIQGYSNTLTLVGIGEYDIRDGSPVTVRLETGGGADYFVGFNRATGPNRMNDEGDDQVTIIQVQGGSGESYGQSSLKAKLSQGQSYAISNFGGTGKTVTITALSIDISTAPGTAVVYITDGLVPAPPSPPPTPAPVTPAPTIASCPGAQEMMEVQIQTDNYPGETTWTLTDKCGSGGVILQGGPYGSANSPFSSNVCANDGQYEFQINDTYGDGICCSYGNGSYLVKFGTAVKASGGEFTSSETKTFGTCAVAQEAVFDSSYGVPRCANMGSSCDSLALLDGRGTISNGNEPNLSNTNNNGNTCNDGSSGSYHSDESIDQITVTAGDIVSGTPVPSGDFIVEGGRAYVTVKLWCWYTGASDTADIFLTQDASSPDWELLDSITCPGGGEQTIVQAFDVPKGTNQSIRVNFRWGGSASTCSNGSYDDHDDLIFTVKENPNFTPTSQGLVASSGKGKARNDAMQGAIESTEKAAEDDGGNEGGKGKGKKGKADEGDVSESVETASATTAKYVCTRIKPIQPETICDDGSPADETCTKHGQKCGKEGKKCWFADCGGDEEAKS